MCKSEEKDTQESKGWVVLTIMSERPETFGWKKTNTDIKAIQHAWWKVILFQGYIKSYFKFTIISK